MPIGVLCESMGEVSPLSLEGFGTDEVTERALRKTAIPLIDFFGEYAIRGEPVGDNTIVADAWRRVVEYHGDDRVVIGRMAELVECGLPPDIMERTNLRELTHLVSFATLAAIAEINRPTGNGEGEAVPPSVGDDFTGQGEVIIPLQKRATPSGKAA